MLFNSAHAQTAATAAAGSTNYVMEFLPYILMFVIIYFLMIRPQQKRAKEHKAMIEALAKGDEVVTQGGIAGKITNTSENYLTVEIAPNVEIQVQKGSIAIILPKGSLKNL